MKKMKTEKKEASAEEKQKRHKALILGIAMLVLAILLYGIGSWLQQAPEEETSCLAAILKI